MKAPVCVIIATMALPARAATLRRAIGSIRKASASPVRIIVVVNGDAHEKGTCDWLNVQQDVSLFHLKEPSSPAAILRGREDVDSDFFATLDDDDEFLEGALDRRIRLMQADPALDLLVTNGFRNTVGSDRPMYDGLAGVASDPGRQLMEFGWLNSANALYRTSSVTRRFFAEFHPYAEWTWLAFQLVMEGRRIGVLDEPTFRVNDTPVSLSKSRAYAEAYFSLYEKMLSCSPPADIARAVRRKRGAAWHDASARALSEGDRMLAVKLHLKSLTQPAGLQYLSYSRRLLMPQD